MTDELREYGCYNPTEFAGEGNVYLVFRPQEVEWDRTPFGTWMAKGFPKKRVAELRAAAQVGSESGARGQGGAK
jgi:hypothetical protein